MSYQHFVAGLDALHLITKDFKSPILRVDLEDFSGNTAYADYRWDGRELYLYAVVVDISLHHLFFLGENYIRICPHI